VGLLNKVGLAGSVLLRQCGPARPDAEWKLVVGKQFFDVVADSGHSE
jgi:hypothetical protein